MSRLRRSKLWAMRTQRSRAGLVSFAPPALHDFWRRTLVAERWSLVAGHLRPLRTSAIATTLSFLSTFNSQLSTFNSFPSPLATLPDPTTGAYQTTVQLATGVNYRLVALALHKRLVVVMANHENFRALDDLKQLLGLT